MHALTTLNSDAAGIGGFDVPVNCCSQSVQCVGQVGFSASPVAKGLRCGFCGFRIKVSGTWNSCQYVAVGGKYTPARFVISHEDGPV